MVNDDAAAGLLIENLEKHFVRASGELVTAVDGVSLTVEPGEFCVLLGPSGCGKTTLLRCIAGLEHPSAGRISIGDRTVFSSADGTMIESRNRGLGMVFQSYALWPHLRVRDNVGFPLTTGARRYRPSKKEVRERVQHALEVVGIGDLGDSSVGALSGGQQQRVALARAIVGGSEVVLFDEPLSNVDAKVRMQLREEIHRLHRELGFMAVYVTHDQEEAMELADRLVVLRSGKIDQEGAPKEIYRAPKTDYVADFVGTTDLLRGEVVAVEEHYLAITTAVGEVHCARTADAPGVGHPATVAIRAEDWVIEPMRDANEGAAANTWVGSVEHSAFLGAFTQHVVDVGEQHFRVRTNGSRDLTDRKMRITIEPELCRLVVS